MCRGSSGAAIGFFTHASRVISVAFIQIGMPPRPSRSPKKWELARARVVFVVRKIAFALSSDPSTAPPEAVDGRE